MAYAQAMAISVKGRLPGPAVDPTPLSMKSVETKTLTEIQPTCSRPISRPGIR